MLGWFLLGAATSAAVAVVVNYLMEKQREEYKRAIRDRDKEILRLTAENSYTGGRKAESKEAADVAIAYSVENKMLREKVRKLRFDNAQLRQEIAKVKIEQVIEVE